MPQTPTPIRRIITGFDAAGRSCIVEDGPSPAQRTVAERPGYRMTNLWRTGAADTVDQPDTIADHVGVLPPPRGTVLRIIEWPAEPEDPAQLRRMMDATFTSMYGDATRASGSDVHPGMHLTDTVDYAIVLEGEIVAIMDEGETLMRTGDVLIQRGTNHAWANRSGKPVKLAFVLVSALPRAG